MSFISRTLGKDQGLISIPINAGLMVLLSVLLLALPNVALLTSIVLLMITLALIMVFVGIVFDDEIGLDGNRFALAGGLVLTCLIISFAGIYHVQSQSHPHAFNSKLTRLGAVYFAIGTMSTAGTNGVVARSTAARAELALQELVDITALALLIAGVARRLGMRRTSRRPSSDLISAHRREGSHGGREKRPGESGTSAGRSTRSPPS